MSTSAGAAEAQYAAAAPPFTDATATPDLQMAERFLTALDDSTEDFTFQTFDDAPAKQPGLSRVLHGTIEKLKPVLTGLNDAGAGIFVMVNAGDGRGRRTENVTGVRAVFADFDGTPLPEVWPLDPHIVVESSPGRFHAYWPVSGVKLTEFKRLQEAIATRLGSDPSVNDLPRVMRVPGFIHRKGTPFQSRIADECPAQPYARDQLVAAFMPRVNGQDHAVHHQDNAPLHEHANVLPKTTFIGFLLPEQEVELREALPYLDADSREQWLRTGMALHPYGDQGRRLWDEWSRRSPKYNEHDQDRVWRSCRDNRPDAVTIRSIFAEAQRAGWPNPLSSASEREATQAEQQQTDSALRDCARVRLATTRSPLDWAALEDFWAYLPAHRYLHIATRELWPVESVNGRVEWPLIAGKPIRPSAYLDMHRPIEQLIWAPGEEQVIEGRILDQGGWVEHVGSRVFNLYRAPQVVRGNAKAAARWRDHLQIVYPEQWQHIELWLAHKVQHPGAKINHALVLGGGQGIGKDTLLEPIKCAIGAWNWSEISPAQMLGRFNGWAKAIIVRLAEARDLGEIDRFAFYDHSKVYIAAPPDVLRVDEKNLREHYIVNVLGLIITTNHRTDCLYLPVDDRRHFVAWSDIEKDEFSAPYWSDLWRWYGEGGLADVATHLRELDLSGFDPKAPPPRTRAFEAIVQAGLPQEDGDLAGLIEGMGSPRALTIADLHEAAAKRHLHDLAEFLSDRRQRPRIPHTLERSGYVAVPNPNSTSGKWKVGDRYLPIYAKKSLPFREQIHEARERERRR